MSIYKDCLFDIFCEASGLAIFYCNGPHEIFINLEFLTLQDSLVLPALGDAFITIFF